MMKYISLIVFSLLLMFGGAAAWTFYNFGVVSCQQILTTLAHTEGIGTNFLCSFFGMMVFSALLAYYLPYKIRILCAVASLIGGTYVFSLIPYLRDQTVYSSLYEDEFVFFEPQEKDIPTEKKNLIVIYVESLEEQYADPQYSGEVLTPYLQKQKNTELHFSGYHQLPANKYTLAGINASQCGFLHKLTFERFRTRPNFYQELPCLSDILSRQGYQSFFYQSADLFFANTDYFARQHHYASVKGHKEWKSEFHDIPKGGSWGTPDSFLYARAKQTILQMQEQKQPFLLSLTTIDTHSGETFVDPICGLNDGNKNNVVKCADILLKDFMEWLKTQPIYPNTVVLIMGDHTAHGISNPIYFKQPQERKIENIIFNAVRNDKQKHQWTTFDLAPTILEAMGYHAPALGLGRSLFAKEPTLYEKYGKKFNTMLEQNSAFLEQQTLSDQKIFEKSEKKYFPLAFNQVYQKEKLKEFIPYSDYSEYQFGKLWINQIYLQTPKTDKNIAVNIRGSAFVGNKTRTFEIFANKKRIGEVTFDKKIKDFSFIIPAKVVNQSHVNLTFVCPEGNTWAISSIGIGIESISFSEI